jgi:hypothetical protein
MVFLSARKVVWTPPTPAPSDAAAATTATTATSPLSESEIASLFHLLSDDMLLHDPSRGTCCRNRCSGCAYLDPTSGDFACEEYTAAGGGTTNAADVDGDAEVAPQNSMNVEILNRNNRVR